MPAGLVKSGGCWYNGGRSLRKFRELFPDRVKLRLRFSLNNLKLDGDVLNIPLFMADHTDRLIGLALEQLDLRK